MVRFKAGSASLSSRERRGLRRIAQVYRQRGGAIRVEGHASSRTRNMDLVQHRMVNFNVSLDRANSVARELVRQGVPEQAVFVAALSDSRPLYYEIMPSGDAGNQRAKSIFKLTTLSESTELAMDQTFHRIKRLPPLCFHRGERNEGEGARRRRRRN